VKNSIWVVESNILGKWIPTVALSTRQEARKRQEKLIEPSRVKKYVAQ